MPDLTTLLLAEASEVAKGIKEKDWDHMNPASRKAHGLSGRAQAAEKDPKLGDPAALHAAAARAHAAAAAKTSGADKERHQQAADYHAGRADKRAKRKCKRITGPDHSLAAPVGGAGGPQSPEDIPDISGVSW